MSLITQQATPPLCQFLLKQRPWKKALKCPGFRLISCQSGINKGQNELSSLNLNLDIANMFSLPWKCKVLTSFVISMVSWVKN